MTIKDEIGLYDTFCLGYEEKGALKARTFGDELLRWKESYGKRTALVFQEESLSYEDLEEKSASLASGFLSEGLEHGDTVMLHMTNGIAFLLSFFALVRMGIRPVLLLPTHRENELRAIAAKMKPKALISSNEVLGTDYAAMGEKVRREFPYIRVHITEEGSASSIPLSSLFLKRREMQEEVSHKETAFYLLSGGTTGTPKIIPKSHAAYLMNTELDAERCEYTENTVALAVLSVSHDYPFGNPGILGAMMKGGKAVLAASPDPFEVFPLMVKHEVSTVSLVPAVLKLWMEFLEFDDTEFPALKQFLIGAAKLEDDLGHLVVDRLKIRIFQGYGLGEGITCFTSAEDDEDVMLHTQGKPVSAFDEIRIEGESGEEVPAGVFGELLQKGPYTFTGYYEAPDLNRNLFTEDGFLRTGDRAMIRPDGNLVLGGRVREQINRAGENVIPAEIEHALKQIDGVRDAAVVGEEDEELGEKTLAFLIVEEGLREDKIRSALLQAGLASYKIPDEFVFLDAFPYTNIGKVDKKALKRGRKA